MPFNRRRFLVAAGAFAGASFTPNSRVLAQPRFGRYPFSLGVASGYPHAAGVTLWTRLAPRPLEGGGMPPAAFPVAWEVAADEAFRKIVARGTASALPSEAHSVHVDVSGLEPARTYWYRFLVGSAASATGRTHTAPAAGAPVNRLRLAVACCQQYEQGYYVAHRHMAREDLDCVVHVGDYIYESSWGQDHVRSHNAPEPLTLEDYRARHALYKTDADLQACHAAFPWIVTWDDHEVQNDYADDRSQDLMPRDAFLDRRAAAYQAYYEHMPVPAWAKPRGAAMRLYGSTAFGDLLQLCMLDDRQYRTHQVCAASNRGGSNVVRDEDCPDRRDDKVTMLGADQERWLHETLGRSRARWNVVAQQTLMSQNRRRSGTDPAYWTDGWDGYPRARERLLQSISAQRVRNAIIVGGDIHQATIADLKMNFDEDKAPVIATEIVAPSITSQGPAQKRTEAIMQENPHIKFADGMLRGYATLDLTPRRCVVRFRRVWTVKERDADVRNYGIFAVEDARPGAVRV
jgi:alkaline phosphatase D